MTKLKVWLSWVLLVTTLIFWPVSLFTFAKDEPPFILSLSWLALTLTALDTLFTAYVSKKQDDDDDDDDDDE